MVGDVPLLFGGEYLGLFLKSADYAVYGIEEVLFVNRRFVVACGYEGGLVADVRYVRT